MARSMVGDRLELVRERIALSCQKAGRKTDQIRIVGVTKGVDIALIREAMACGLTLLGENRVQEMERKREALEPEKVQWHFIGNLQTNKIPKVIEYFQYIHSLDRENQALSLDKCLRTQREEPYPVLVQVNVTGKPTQGGIEEHNLNLFLESIQPLRHIQVIGLMTIGPEGNEDQIRRAFCRLRELKERIEFEKFDRVLPVLELSMGMSNDYQVAVEEGATYLRLGRCLFGERSR